MKKKKESGQAIVEIALMLPIFAFILCGIVDFGRILNVGITINMIAQESVRYAALNKYKSNSEVQSFAEVNCPLNASYLSVTTTPDASTTVPRPSGSNVKVDVSYTVNYITPIKNIIGNSFTVRTSSTMRVE